MAVYHGTGIVVQGFEELRRNTEGLIKQHLDQATMLAQDAAAAVMKQAIVTASPPIVRYKGRKYGPIKTHIIVYEARNRKALFAGAARRRLLIGPSRDAFYAYFLEMGTRKMSAHPFMRSACDMVEQEAFEAGRAAFEQYIGLKVRAY